MKGPVGVLAGSFVLVCLFNPCWKALHLAASKALVICVVFLLSMDGVDHTWATSLQPRLLKLI